MALDSHVHFWRYNPEEYPWIQPDWPIKRDFLPNDLQPNLTKCGIDQCIAVQARQSLRETQWLLELAIEHPIIRGVVGWVDLQAETVSEQLTELARRPRFLGVRHVVQDEPDDNFLVRPEFMRGIALLKKFGLSYDLLIFPHQLPAAIKLARNFSSQRFVVDHLAKPRIKDRQLASWKELIAELANCPNVWCKLSGMVTEAAWGAWRQEDFEPYIDIVLEKFGPGRLMFGSDWPVCQLSGSYEVVVEIVRNKIAGLNRGDQDAIMGGNAEKFYLELK